jgi:AcrR family transcriptional regulator
MPKKIDEVKLFETVISDWMKHGYAGSTTKEIAKVAGINEATLFRRYGSKAQLFATAIDQQLADVPLARVAVSDDLQTDLLALAEAYVATFEAHGNVVFRMLQEIPQHPEIKQAVSNMLRNIQLMLQVMVSHQQKGHLRPEHPMLTLTSFIGPIGFYLMSKQSGIRDDIPPFNVPAHVALFLNGRAATD